MYQVFGRQSLTLTRFKNKLYLTPNKEYTYIHTNFVAELPYQPFEKTILSFTQNQRSYLKSFIELLTHTMKQLLHKLSYQSTTVNKNCHITNSDITFLILRVHGPHFRLTFCMIQNLIYVLTLGSNKSIIKKKK